MFSISKQFRTPRTNNELAKIGKNINFNMITLLNLTEGEFMTAINLAYTCA